MELSGKFSIAQHALSKDLDGKTVILDMTIGTYYGLDEVGARIWTLMSESLSVSEICSILLDEYDVPRSELENDIIKLANELIARKLIETQ